MALLERKTDKLDTVPTVVVLALNITAVMLSLPVVMPPIQRSWWDPGTGNRKLTSAQR